MTGQKQGPYDELWLAFGRRGGKSHTAAFVSTYEGAFRDHRDKLSPGEWATVPMIAADRYQARTVMRYIRANFDHKTIYNRFYRWSALGVFGRIFVELAKGGGETDEIMIDATHLKAHRTAASLLKKGFFRGLSDEQKAA